MGDKEVRFDSLLALETAERIFIRPYARMNEFVGYLVYIGDTGLEHEATLLGRIIYNIEVNEKINQLRIRDETRVTKFTCIGSLFEPEKELAIWYQRSHVIGTVYENYAQEQMESGQNNKLVYSSYFKYGSTRFVVCCQHKGLGHIYKNEKACYVGIRFKKPSMVEKLMIMVIALKFFYCKYQLHQHPLPSNLLHTREASIPTNRPILETCDRGIMRISFGGMGKTFFAEILNAVTHNIELVIQYTISPAGEVVKYFMDVFGNLLFTSNFPGGGNTTENVIRGDGQRIGYITMEKGTNFFDSHTGCAIMGLRKVDGLLVYPDNSGNIFQVFVAGQPSHVICDFYDHSTQGNIRINLLQAVSMDKKAMILAHIAFLAIFYYKDINKFLKPTVLTYPMQNESLL